METEETNNNNNNDNIIDNNNEITQEKKKKNKVRPFFNVRAHSNPLADKPFENTPVRPKDFDWSTLYPEFYEYQHKTNQKLSKVEMADVGCGFGGLLVALSPEYPESLIVGMEIRDKVANYVNERILDLRLKSIKKNQENGEGEGRVGYGNISCIRTNAMKYLPNFFEKGQLKKIFFLFPDPHFKKSNFRRRIISQTLLDEYAFVLREGGRLYTITDVKELYDWEVKYLNLHPLFRAVPEEEIKLDVAAQLIQGSSEEGKKVSKNLGSKWLAVYERIPA